MSHTRVKICGITRSEDAQLVADAGADAIGLVFYPASPRAVDAKSAARIVSGLSPFVSVVALFVNEPAESINRILDSVPIDVIQFHGDESAKFCGQFGRPYLKALRVKPGEDLLAASQQYDDAKGILLDTWQDGVPGGTGKTFDWTAAQVQFPCPLVLAGGLTPANVSSAVEIVRPAAVDVSGGVESAPGIKNGAAVREFISAVRAADQNRK
ncbi:MAG: phosphoribosylanthranilate isomerase [Halioglobus sp.]